jgi:hypothetical protein
MGKIKAISTASNITVMYETITKERKVIQCEYVGCSQNDFIVIRYPTSMAPRCNTDPFSAGHVIRMSAIVNLNSKEIVTFTSTILTTISTNDRLLFVSYPEKVESKILRTEPRLSVELMAEVSFFDKPIKPILCLIKDVSLSGIGCEFQMRNEHDDLNIEQLLNEKCVLDVDMSVYGLKNYKFNATIKNINIKEKIQLGLLFEQESQEQVTMLFEKLAVESVLY